ncbi:MAG: NAD(P)/FAD-dependent oxidoreductase [Faecalibacterium prausnitzii]|nr:NAD(P)/FAD-dependent oxidoreductase [Faecalibacterium prausnitzii]
MSKIVIVGSGPAGVSAALYAVRAGVDTTVLTRGAGALDRAEKIENYYGFDKPVSGAELERRSVEGAKRLGVKFVSGEAVGITYTDRLTVETLAGDYPADAVILATGASRAAPRLPGLAELEGHGVSWCATCDAFFYRGKDVAVLGSGEYALHEVQALLPVVKSVTLLTNGAAMTAQFPPEVQVLSGKVEALLGEKTLSGVRLADGSELAVSGVFVALGVAGSTALARKIGAAVEGDRILVDHRMQTTVPGLYAAGDCTGGMLQVAKAVYEGALAGSEAAKAVRKGAVQ